METTPISGKEIARNLREEVKNTITKWKSKGSRAPGLAAVIVGDYPPSRVYVASKHKACAEAGIDSWVHQLPEKTTQDELHQVLESLNRDPLVDGILLQLPLPRHLVEAKAISVIHPDKDVDGLHPVSLGRLVSGQEGFRPCTPFGVMHILEKIGCDPAGKNALVLGRSTIVGKPMALLLAEKGSDATVTIAHSRTRDLAKLCREADILIAAIGQPEFVRGDWVKPGGVVIDVGINRLPDGRLVGDVAYAECLGIASAITPVPGGVGPMTIAMLLKNTMVSAGRKLGIL